MSKQTFEDIKGQLKKQGQEHLLAFWDELDATQRQLLAAQIQKLDLEKIKNWIGVALSRSQGQIKPQDLQPCDFYPASPVGTGQQKKYKQAKAIGKGLIAAGRVAALLVAGGQGTRLGFDDPKGNLRVSPIKDKTLFEIFGETIAAVQKRYGTICPWYIMTSNLNDQRTKEVFQENNWYGLDKNDIFIFKQGGLPNLSLDGKILLSAKDKISFSPDGHGGCLTALHDSGAISDMKKRGVEYISYFQVDNPLVNIFDGLFIGLHVLDSAEISSKAVIKSGPKEKVGNLCLRDGRLIVIEYSDMPDELSTRCNSDGTLTFSLGSIAIHIINVAFAERLNRDKIDLPLHKATKKIPYIDSSGRHITPTKENAIKLERFIFDALPFATRSVVLETLRDEEFAPIKDVSGPDSIESARLMMINRAAVWLEYAGATIPRKKDGSIDAIIEIAPSFAIEKKDIKKKAHQIPKITPKAMVYLA